MPEPGSSSTTPNVPRLPSGSPTSKPYGNGNHATPTLSAKGISERTQAKRVGNNKKRKYPSPFRIKVGCLVAVRYRAGGNRISSITGTTSTIPPHYLSSAVDSNLMFSEVWADPQPGKDDGLALIGNRIRCCFPKLVLSESFDKRATTRFLEGEVVSIPSYTVQFKAQRKMRRKRKTIGTRVHLLIDRTKLDALPFLKRVDRDVDPSLLTGSAKRHHENEIRIKGKDKATVEVVLAQVLPAAYRSHITSDEVEAKWVLRKRVPAKKLVSKSMSNGQGTKKDDLSSTSDRGGTYTKGTGNDGANNSSQKNGGSVDKAGPASLPSSGEPNTKRRKINTLKDFAKSKYVGDGDDAEVQQEANWRWQASKLDPTDFTCQHPFDETLAARLSYNFVGEVVSITPAPSDAETLAWVTVRRLFLPEHLARGRGPRHGSTDIFVNLPTIRSALSDFGEIDSLQFQVAVEDLIILARRLGSDGQNIHEVGELASHQICMMAAPDGSLQSPSAATTDSDTKISKKESYCNSCSRCAKLMGNATIDGEWASHDLCEACQNSVDSSEARNGEVSDGWMECGCTSCTERAYLHQTEILSKAAARSDNSLVLDDSVDENAFSRVASVVGGVTSIGFSLAPTFLNPMEIPSSKPITGTKSRRRKKARKSVLPFPPKNPEPEAVTTSDRTGDPQESTNTPGLPEFFCSRLVSYDVKTRKFEMPSSVLSPGIGDSTVPSSDRPRNLREAEGPTGHIENDKDEKFLNSRAARANQRRLLRDVVAMGVSFDALAGREQQLRFDRSSIHAWGVFADEEIKEGEMLVEYRGEIIGNAMAEKREIEYEDAKIGSDYMFRIDNHYVCDATKQGNVARFINASCDPNCTTRIISTDGTKRIAIYTKRDIRAGEELCYDYKFPLEYDETKRIACHCGAKDCRGFMNWDKRYKDVHSDQTVGGTETTSGRKTKAISDDNTAPDCT